MEKEESLANVRKSRYYLAGGNILASLLFLFAFLVTHKFWFAIGSAILFVASIIIYWYITRMLNQFQELFDKKDINV